MRFFCCLLQWQPPFPLPLPPPFHCVTVNVQQYIFCNAVEHPCATWGIFFPHMGARPHANVQLFFHGCHGGPFSFLLVSWLISVSQRLSVFKVASASKYSNCQWSSTKDKEDTMYRKFSSLCLFDFSDPAECGVSVTEPRQRIVRGNKATSGVWPWQINIYWDGRHCRLSLMLSQVLVAHDVDCRLYEYGYNVIYFNSILTFYFLSFVF